MSDNDDKLRITVDRYPFAQVPEGLIYDTTLTDKAVRVYCALLRHGQDPARCFPSKRRLGELLGCAPASLGRPLRSLEEAGWITRVARTGPNGAPASNGYHVHLNPAQQSAGVRAPERGGTRSGARGVRAPERDVTRATEREQPNENPPNPPEPLEMVLDDAPSGGPTVDPFVAFWTEYPRKVGKPTAERAYRKVAAEHAAILEGLARWNRYWSADGTERKFIPHPSRWLNDRRWEDEPPPVRANGGKGGGGRGPRWVPDPTEEQAERSRPGGLVSEEELWG